MPGLTRSGTTRKDVRCMVCPRRRRPCGLRRTWVAIEPSAAELSRRHLGGACVANGQFRLPSEQRPTRGFAPSARPLDANRGVAVDLRATEVRSRSPIAGVWTVFGCSTWGSAAIAPWRSIPSMSTRGSAWRRWTPMRSTAAARGSIPRFSAGSRLRSSVDLDEDRQDRRDARQRDRPQMRTTRNYDILRSSSC